MEFEDDAFVLSARPFGEAGAIVEMLTRGHGRYAAHVAGGASRKLKPLLQAGAPVTARYRARISDQLGSATLEASGEGPAALFDDPLALAGIAAAAAVAAGALPEREPHPGAYLAFAALSEALAGVAAAAGSRPARCPNANRTPAPTWPSPRSPTRSAASTTGPPSSCASKRVSCRNWVSASISPSAPPPASPTTWST